MRKQHPPKGVVFQEPIDGPCIRDFSIDCRNSSTYNEKSTISDVNGYIKPDGIVSTPSQTHYFTCEGVMVSYGTEVMNFPAYRCKPEFGWETPVYGIFIRKTQYIRLMRERIQRK